MRNWSSYLYNVTYSYNISKKYNDNAQFGITKTLYNDKSKTANQSRAINKGIYLFIPSSANELTLNDAIIVAKNLPVRNL